MSSVVRLMRTGPRKLPALPQPSGSSLSPRALHLPAENRHFCAEISNARLIYYTSKPPFFQITVFVFVLKPQQNRPFSRTINRKKPLFSGFSRRRTPGCVYIGIHTFHPQNARMRVRLSIFRTLRFSQAKSIRIFTIFPGCTCGAFSHFSTMLSAPIRFASFPKS